MIIFTWTVQWEDRAGGMVRHWIFSMWKQNINVLWSQVHLWQALSTHLNRGKHLLRVVTLASMILFLFNSLKGFQYKQIKVLDVAGHWIGEEFSEAIVALHGRLVKAKEVLERGIWVGSTCLCCVHWGPCNSFGISALDDPKCCLQRRSRDQRRRSHAYALRATTTLWFSPTDSY